LLVRLAALHDIGKLAPAFQAKAQPSGWHWPVQLDAASAVRGPSEGHPADGHLLWEDSLASRFGSVFWPNGRNQLNSLLPAVFGHHGRPVVPPSARPFSSKEVFGGRACQLAQVFVEHVVGIVPVPTVELPRVAHARVKRASWWVAGLITLADWVGSNDNWFPYHEPRANDPDLRGYWNEARDRAVRAVRLAGLVPPTPARGLGYAELANLTCPTPLQREMASVSLGTGPVLAIVEDATGAGKTEAAQMFVHRLLADGRASGAYWAMPTQATANAMYERQAGMLRALFARDARAIPSLVLAHAGARLHDGFRATVTEEELGPPDARAGDSLDELPSEVACTAFLADDRRAGLLADIGVGTIDQAFLGVLPVRFNALRLFALSEKVLVVDEVHAFDEYMRSEAEGLMRAHAALGGSAVLLSATLTAAQRTKLAQAWRASLGLDDSLDSQVGDAGAAYPLLTVVRDGGRAVEARSFGSPEWTRRTVSVRWLGSEHEAMNAVLAASRAGACVAWIRNTVGACVQSARALEDVGVQPLVFHARFTPGDRQRIEADVLGRFGKRSHPSDRQGRVLVATQVVEQSLDLDFDVMITDIAPVDLLIQRAGRLWRHQRLIESRHAGDGPELLVLSGPLDGDVGADWVAALGTKTEWIYQNPGVLWRSAQVLASAGGITAPDGVRALVEAAYGDDPVPASFIAAISRAYAEGRAASSIAAANVLRLDREYGDAAALWTNDATYETRLGEPTVKVRLARVRAYGELEPWEFDERLPVWQRWAMSDVSVRRSQLRGAFDVPPGWMGAVTRARAGWGAFEQSLPVVVLVEVGAGEWRGNLASLGSGAVVEVRYCTRTGLTVSNSVAPHRM
jgi:CRISPR-associated endonuclease/helicase Cas3